MRGFAVVANEGVVFDTDCREAIFRVCAAVGTGGIAGLTGERLYGLFGVGWHGCLLVSLCLYYLNSRYDRAGATSSSSHPAMKMPKCVRGEGEKRGYQGAYP